MRLLLISIIMCSFIQASAQESAQPNPSPVHSNLLLQAKEGSGDGWKIAAVIVSSLSLIFSGVSLKISLLSTRKNTKCTQIVSIIGELEKYCDELLEMHIQNRTKQVSPSKARANHQKDIWRKTQKIDLVFGKLKVLIPNKTPDCLYSEWKLKLGDEPYPVRDSASVLEYKDAKIDKLISDTACWTGTLAKLRADVLNHTIKF